jgi:hypothetical protein
MKMVSKKEADKIPIKQGWISIRLQKIAIMLQVVSIVLLIFINIQIPNLLKTSDLVLICNTPQNNPGKVILTVYNNGNYVSNGTISIHLLKNGIYEIDTMNKSMGSLSPNAGKNYEFKFSQPVYSSTNYSIYIRVDSGGRITELTVEAHWYS